MASAITLSCVLLLAIAPNAAALLPCFAQGMFCSTDFLCGTCGRFCQCSCNNFVCTLACVSPVQNTLCNAGCVCNYPAWISVVSRRRKLLQSSNLTCCQNNLETFEQSAGSNSAVGWMPNNINLSSTCNTTAAKQVGLLPACSKGERNALSAIAFLCILAFYAATSFL